MRLFPYSANCHFQFRFGCNGEVFGVQSNIRWIRGLLSVSVVCLLTNDLLNFATDFSGKVDRLGEIVREHITNEFSLSGIQVLL
jgi:hypothetical protein